MNYEDQGIRWGIIIQKEHLQDIQENQYSMLNQVVMH